MFFHVSSYVPSCVTPPSPYVRLTWLQHDRSWTSIIGLGKFDFGLISDHDQLCPWLIIPFGINHCSVSTFLNFLFEPCLNPYLTNQCGGLLYNLGRSFLSHSKSIRLGPYPKTHLWILTLKSIVGLLRLFVIGFETSWFLYLCGLSLSSMLSSRALRCSSWSFLLTLTRTYMIYIIKYKTFKVNSRLHVLIKFWKGIDKCSFYINRR